jgi:uncharacterized protein (UPF0333 family)
VIFLRGQVSIEYLVLTSFLLLVAGILFVYSFSSLSQADYFVKAKNSVERLGNAVEQVSALGEGSQKIIELILPESIVSFTASNTLINLRLNYNDNINDFWFESNSNITPVDLSTANNYLKLKVSFFDGNILISEVS